MHSKRHAMEPSSSSGVSIRSIETYAAAANHPMPANLKARCVVLLCGLFGMRRSHDRCTPFTAETYRPSFTLSLILTLYFSQHMIIYLGNARGNLRGGGILYIRFDFSIFQDTTDSPLFKAIHCHMGQQNAKSISYSSWLVVS